jgi:hypothetical protein
VIAVRWRAAVLVACVSLPAVARAAAPEETPVDCAASPTGRAPDPRCGEALDGREPPRSSFLLAVPRAVLWVPRLVSRVVFWPVVETSDVVEAHHVPNWIEALLTSDDGLVGVRPILHYATGFFPTAGLRFFYRRLPGPGSAVMARAQGAGPTVLLGEVGLVGPTWLGLGLRVLWDRRDDRYFAGIGPNGLDDLAASGRGPARYSSDILLTELRWSRSLPWHFLAGLHGDVQRRDYRAYGVRGGLSIATVFGLATAACQASALPTNACVDPALVPGFAQGLRIGHVGGGVGWDTRNRTRDGSGVSVTMDATYGQGLAGDPSRHVLLSGETVVALGGTDRVLLLRARGATVRALGAAPIPFEELITPAGASGMRGYVEGRFHGESGVLGSAEYRWYIAHNLDASLFTDWGTVAGPAFSGLGTNRWFPSFGVGLRLYSTPAAYWEGALDTGIQLAYAPDGGFRLLLAVATF